MVHVMQRIPYIKLHFATTKCVLVHFLIKLRFTLTRPLIKNILDSPTQYLSNTTFATILALQRREEYIFEKKKFLKNLPKGG